MGGHPDFRGLSGAADPAAEASKARASNSRWRGRTCPSPSSGCCIPPGSRRSQRAFAFAAKGFCRQGRRCTVIAGQPPDKLRSYHNSAPRTGHGRRERTRTSRPAASLPVRREPQNRSRTVRLRTDEAGKPLMYAGYPPFGQPRNLIPQNSEIASCRPENPCLCSAPLETHSS